MRQARILRRSRKAHPVHDEKAGTAQAAPAQPEACGRRAGDADMRMPDFVFGVLRKQTIAGAPQQAAYGGCDDSCPSSDHPISSRADAGSADLPAERSGVMHAPRAAPGAKKVSAHLFTSYAHKARR
jgi:hypothetical protein